MLLFITPTIKGASRIEIFKYISCYCLSVLHRQGIGSVIQFKYISCYCLSGSVIHDTIQVLIQIHLMLLFIVPSSCKLPPIRQFKYISCYCLSAAEAAHPSTFTDSNTSHVIVYLSRSPPSQTLSVIQIHLMLLFIGLFTVFIEKESKFKYISCYCLSVVSAAAIPLLVNSNTSHVIVYRYSGTGTGHCRFIQIHLMLLFIIIASVSKNRCTYSNTSHVIVYREEGLPFGKPLYLFKYISCYCLSYTAPEAEGAFYAFKYISCYCLSWSASFSLSYCVNSNTSHVIVYRNIQCITDLTRKIQIHLMLLFIRQRSRKSAEYPSIQIHLMLLFISSSSCTASARLNSNTSHVIVYLSRTCARGSRKVIQIHLMLLFI